MLRLLLILIALSGVAHSQAFPAPGTGPYTWERVGDYPTNTRVFAFSPEGRLFAFAISRQTGSPSEIFAFVPAPGGPPAGTWQHINSNRQIGNSALLPLSADTLLYGNLTAIYRTTDGGATSSQVNSNPLGFGGNYGGPDTADAMLELPPGHPYAGRLISARFVLYSDDRGATWTEATLPPGTEDSKWRFAAMPSGRILAAYIRGVAASDDGGESYGYPVFGLSGAPDALAAFATPGSVQSGAPDCGLPDPSLCDGAVVFGASGLAGQGGAMLRTNDGGRTWSPITQLSQPTDGIGSSSWAGVVALAPGPDGLGRGVAVGYRGVVYTSVDGGVTWEPVGRLPLGVDADLGGHLAQLMRLGPDGHLWVTTAANNPATPEWIYRSAEPAEAAFAVSSEATPTEARTLDISVRPNPSQGRVRVSITSAEARTVRVVVVDALGREVAVVLDGAVSGAREVSLDTSAWPAGVYVVRASAGGQGATARLTVAR